MSGKWKSLWDTCYLISPQQSFSDAYQETVDQSRHLRTGAKLSGVEWESTSLGIEVGRRRLQDRKWFSGLEQGIRLDQMEKTGEDVKVAKSLLCWGSSGKSSGAGVVGLPHLWVGRLPLVEADGRHTGKWMCADGSPHGDKNFEIAWSSLFLKKPLEGFTFSIPADNRPF